MRFILIAEDEKTATPFDTYPDVEEKEEDDNNEPLIIEEGEIGVWVGFSSADRCSFGGELPISDSEDFIGNGDPTFFLTVGQPSGQPVPAVKSVSDDGAPHPLYAAWLATHS